MADIDPDKIKVLPPGRRPRKNTAQFGGKHRTSAGTRLRDGALGVGGVVEINTGGHQGFVKDPTADAAESRVGK